MFLVALGTGEGHGATVESARYKFFHSGLSSGGLTASAARARIVGGFSDLASVGATVQGSRTALRSGAIGQLNDPPEVTSGHLDVPMDSEAELDLTPRDVDGDSLQWTELEAPAHGALTGSLPRLRYQPNSGFSGEDRFRIRIEDSHGGWAVSTWTVSVSQVANRPPVVLPLTIHLLEDSRVPVVLQASDPDGGDLEFRIVVPPARGSLFGIPPNLEYVPFTDEWGVDAIEFEVRDAHGASTPGSVHIEIQFVNDSPQIILPASVEGASAAGEVRIPFTVTDVDADAALLSLSVRSSNPGLVPDASLSVVGSGNDRILVARWTPGHSGRTSLEIEVTDPYGATQISSTELTVVPEVTPPVLTRQPEDLDVGRGATARFRVTVDGEGSLQFQWYRGDVQIPGATSAELEIRDIEITDAGGYSVRVTNPAGATISRTALLRVLEAPAPTDFVGRVTSGGFLLRWVLPNGSYFLDGSSDLEIWFVLGQDEVTDGVLEFLDTDFAGRQARFYRLRAGSDAAVRAWVAGSRGPDGHRLRSFVPPGTYRWEASDDLRTWQLLVRVESSGGGITVLDDQAAAHPRRFYRLVRE